MELSGIKERLVDYFSSLSDREKRVFLVGTPVVLLVLYTVAVVFPVVSLKEKYEKKVVLYQLKFKKIEPEVKELLCLKERLSPVEEKLKRGANLDVPSYVQTVARMVGLSLKKVKVMPGEEKAGYTREIVSVSFKEADVNRVARFISKLEKGSYYFKADGISISDYDENGLVSGKVTLFFYRRSSEG